MILDMNAIQNITGRVSHVPLSPEDISEEQGLGKQVGRYTFKHGRIQFI